MITDGWPYVIWAYGVTYTGLIGYALGLVWRIAKHHPGGQHG